MILYRHTPIILAKLAEITEGFKTAFSKGWSNYTGRLVITLRMFNITLQYFREYSLQIMDNLDAMVNVYHHIPIVSKMLVIMSKSFRKWMDLKMTDKVVQTFTNWHMALANLFNPRVYKGAWQQSRLFGKFTKNVEALARVAPMWKLMAKGMNDTATGMERYAVAVNSFNPEKLQMVEGLMAHLAAISKRNYSMDMMGKNLGDGIERGFELLAEKVMEIIQEQQNNLTVLEKVGNALLPGDPFGKANDYSGDGKAQTGTEKKGGGGNQMAKSIASAVGKAVSKSMNELTTKTLTVKSASQYGGDKVTF